MRAYLPRWSLFLLFVLPLACSGLAHGQVLSLVYDVKHSRPDNHEWARSSNPREFSVVDDTLYFYTSSPGIVPHLSWLEDDELAVLDRQILAGYPIVFQGNKYQMRTTRGSGPGSGPYDLFRYDGNSATKVTNINFRGDGMRLVASDDSLYFTAHPIGESKLGIWKYDGVETTYVADFGQGEWDSFGSPRFFPADDSLYYTAENEAGGESLWRMTNDTVEVVEELGNDVNSRVSIIETLGSQWLIRSGSKLWNIDGEAVSLVGDLAEPIVPATADDPLQNVDWSYFGATAYGNQPLHGVWRTDGTALELAFELRTEGNPRSFTEPTILGETLIFESTDETEQRGIWKYEPGLDPTLVFEYPDSAKSFTANLTAFDGHVYFGAADEDGQNRWWRTDGTMVELMADVIPGMPNSHGFEGIVFNGEFYFNGSTPETGAELWKLSPVPEPSTVLLAVVGLGLLALRRRFATCR